MNNKANIKTELLGIIMLAGIAIGCLFLFQAGKMAYREIFKKKLCINQFQDKLSAETKRINTIIESAQSTPQDLAAILEFHDTDDAEVKILLQSVLFNNPELFGSAIAYEAYMHNKDSLYDSPFVYRTGDTIAFTNLNGPEYNYFYKDWYLIPKTLMKPSWSEPYYDEGGGNSLMSTYSVPFYKFQGDKERFYGIVTVDVSIDILTKAVVSIGKTLKGYALLISENGTILSAPDSDLIFNETIFTLAVERKQPAFREIGRELQQGKSGYRKLVDPADQKEFYAFYSSVPANKWGLIILMEENELLKRKSTKSI